MENIFNYENAIYIIDLVFLAVVLVMAAFGWYYIAAFFLALKKTKEVPHSDKKTKFAILIPARDESHVIHNIIRSLKEQTYPKEFFDVFFIVENAEDKTVKIVKENGYHSFVRDELTPNRRTKGYALQECIRFFKREGMVYDAYMIFDADNILDPKYIETMNDLRQSGKEVGLGYRNFTNPNSNWLTTCSAALFSFINSFTSIGRTMLFKKATIAGTGYYVNAEIIDEAGGWIFTGLTEDMELTTYCYYHDINMAYYPLVDFYDEQATGFKTNHNQHIRWIWGYMENKKAFKIGGKNHHATSKAVHRAAIYEYNLVILPFAFAVVIDFLLSLVSLGLTIASIYTNPVYTETLLMHFLLQFGIVYFLLLIAPIAVMIVDRKKLKLKPLSIIWCIFGFCFYAFDLLLAFFDGLFRKKKRKTWAPIKHTGEVEKNK